jgi:hypothetical protein
LSERPSSPSASRRRSTAFHLAAATDAIKIVEVLTGGISDRCDDNVGGLGAEAMAILEQLAAEKRGGH